MSVDLSKRMRDLAKIILVFYCAVLTIMPLSCLHVEDLLPATALLTSQAHLQTDLIVLIHEALYAHLRNATDYLFGSVAWLFDQLIFQMSETLFLDGVGMTESLLSLNVLVAVLSMALKYVYKRGKTLSRTILCYRLFLHSPPALYSL